MTMLTFIVDKNKKLIDVKKSKEKGLFESKKDQAYADKILYTWQVVGVGAGYIIKAFNHRLCR